MNLDVIAELVATSFDADRPVLYRYSATVVLRAPDKAPTAATVGYGETADDALNNALHKALMMELMHAGTEVHVLDHHEAEGQPASYYADHLHRWESEHGRAISRHYLPHDAGRRSLNDATSYQDTLARLGFRNTEVIPASHDVWWGINLLRDLLPRCVFHARCLRPWKDSTEKERLSLVQCLEAYRKRPGGGPGGVIHEEPVHDAASHSADAMRMIAEARTRGLIPALDPAARSADRPPRRSVKMHVGG